MIYFLIAAGIIVVALCAHFSTKSYEAQMPAETTKSEAFWQDESYGDIIYDAAYGGVDWDDEDIISDPAYSSLSCNIFHDDC